MASRLNLKPTRRVNPGRAAKPRVITSLNLSPVRSQQSLALDGKTVTPRGTEEEVPLPQYLHWGQFQQWFRERWKVGEHIAAVGESGSGKTTLCRNLLMQRSFVVVLGTKTRDEELYPGFEALGFVKKEKWNPVEYKDTKERYVIFAPPLDIEDDVTEGELADAEEEQASKFRTALIQINKIGCWCVFGDEIATIAIDMGLKRTLNLLYREGRSKYITLVSATQRPREVPLNIFQQAKWFFIWNIADRDDRYRAAQYTGTLMPVVDYTTARLPRHQFVCVHKPTMQIVTSRVGG